MIILKGETCKKAGACKWPCIARQPIEITEFHCGTKKRSNEMVRAKFKVESVTNHANGFGEVSMAPVTTGSEENKSFWKYTPSGSLKMSIDNPAALEQFKPGKEFYVDFHEAE